MSKPGGSGPKARPDISMEDTDAAGQRIPDDLADALSADMAKSSQDSAEEARKRAEPDPGESFSGAPTLAPASLAEDTAMDFDGFAEVDPDDYVFGTELARGGMGRILSARDRRTGRAVAIKEVLPELIAGLSAKERDGLIARFQREARVTALLQHPSIVPVYELGNFNGRPFFAMKKIEGAGLDSLIEARKTLQERLELVPTIVSIADALAYAHGQQVVHRDLKSSNILVGAFGETVVIDWGLAKSMSDVESDGSTNAGKSNYDSAHPLKTVVGSIFGTPHFMPPEQARGDVVDARADVYAIGSILYHLLSGQAPYADTQGTPHSGSLLRKLREEPPEPLSKLVPDAPRDLLSIVDKAMSRDQSLRYPTAAELAADLADFSAGQRVAVHDYSTGELVSRWLRRHRTAVATALVLLSALVVTATVSFLSVMDNRDQAEAQAKLAQSETKRADRTTDEAMEFLAERGRIDLLEERPVHALVLLSKAFAHLPHRPANQLLIAAAMRSIDALQLSLAPHNAPITALVLSHDKRKMLSASEDGEVRIWDLASGKMLTAFVGQRGYPIIDPSFSLDDSKVLSAGNSGVDLWSVVTGKSVLSIEENIDYAGLDYKDRLILIYKSGQVAALDLVTAEKVDLHTLDRLRPLWSAAMSVDGKSLILIFDRVLILDLEKDRLRVNPTNKRPHVVAMGAGLSGGGLITANGNGTVQLWDLQDMQPMKTVSLDYMPERDLALVFSPNGKLIANVAPDGRVVIHDVESDQRIAGLELGNAGITQIHFSPDSKFLVTASQDEVVRVWDVATGRRRIALVGHAKPATALLFTPDSKSIFVGDAAGAIRKWDTTFDIVLHEMQHGASHTGLDPTGRRMLVSGEASGLLLDAETQEIVATLGDKAQLDSARFSADGSRFISGSRIFKSEDGSLVRDLDFDVGSIFMFGINSDGSLVGYSNMQTMRVWNVETGKLLFESTNHSAGVSPMWFSKRGDYVFAMLEDFRLGMLDLTTGKVAFHFGAPRMTRDLVSILANPEQVAIHRHNQGVDVVEAHTGKLVRTLPGTYNAITVAPDGVRLLAASDSHAVVWNSETGVVETTIEDPLARHIYGAAVSKNGAFLALAGANIVSVYDRERATLLARASIGSSSITSLVFGPGDETLIIGTSDQAIVLDIHRETRSPESIEKLVEERVPRVLKKGHFLPSPSIDAHDGRSSSSVNAGNHLRLILTEQPLQE